MVVSRPAIALIGNAGSCLILLRIKIVSVTDIRCSSANFNSRDQFHWFCSWVRIIHTVSSIAIGTILSLNLCNRNVIACKALFLFVQHVIETFWGLMGRHEKINECIDVVDFTQTQSESSWSSSLSTHTKATSIVNTLSSDWAWCPNNKLTRTTQTVWAILTAGLRRQFDIHTCRDIKWIHTLRSENVIVSWHAKFK